jgi:hypothetical protein
MTITEEHMVSQKHLYSDRDWGSLLRTIIAHYHDGYLEIPDSALLAMPTDLLIYRIDTGIVIRTDKDKHDTE